MSCRYLRVRTAVTLGVAMAGAARAQTVTGTLVPGPTNETVSGILVQLLDAAGASVVGTLSTEEGRFVLRAPAPGSYRVRALHVGYRPTVSETLTLAADENRALQLVLTGTVVTLSAVTVSESRVCNLRDDARSQTALAWQEVLKALSAAIAARGARPYEVRIALVEEQLDDKGQRVLGTRVTEKEGASVAPFRSVDPESLVQAGFVTASGNMTTFYGPDADVLVSSAFARTHCLRLVRDAGDTLIAIAFEPLRQTRTPDIEGVVRIDRRSDELRDIEYRYTGLNDVPVYAAGGHIEFARMPPPNNTWVVSRWAIRMPMVEARRTSGFIRGSARRFDIRGVQRSGGEVLVVRNGADTLWRGRRNAIEGTVATPDAAPRADVPVELRELGREARTDAAGRFRFEALFPATYSLQPHDPVLTGLGFTAAAGTVTAPDSGVATITLRVPTLDAAIAGTCGQPTVDSLALLRVILTDAEQTPVREASVDGAWLQSANTQTDFAIAVTAHRVGDEFEPGVYWLCGVPRERPLTIRATLQGQVVTATTRIPADVPYFDVQMRMQP